MMAAVAAYADSDSGRFHALVSQSYGTDPAQGVTDPLVAANLRAALLVVTSRTETDVEPDFEAKYG
jgi:hypothetical protein